MCAKDTLRFKTLNCAVIKFGHYFAQWVNKLLKTLFDPVFHVNSIDRTINCVIR